MLSIIDYIIQSTGSDESKYNNQIMIKSKHTALQQVILLKHMQLEPEHLQINIGTVVSINIAHSNSSQLTHCIQATARKFIFLLEQTDEETPLMNEGEQYNFTTVFSHPATYNIQCQNYPKIRCQIQVLSPPQQKIEATDFSQQPRLQPNLNNLTEVKQQKQQQTRQHGEGVFESNSKSQLAEYERMLNDEEMHYDYMPNRYLRYFKEQFKLWRDFFDSKPTQSKNDKYGSQSREKQSNASLTFSQRQSEKDESVISHLRSQQEMSDLQQEQNPNHRIMKKTNSQYGFNVERELQKTQLSSASKRRPIHTNTCSPHQATEHSEANSFVDWTCNWANQYNLQSLNTPKKNDRHIVKQWFIFLQNSKRSAIQNSKQTNSCMCEGQQ